MTSKIPRIILASSSPRRRELFSGFGLAFDVISPSIVEKHRSGEAPLEYCQRNAREKADAVRAGIVGAADFIVVSADTIVVLNEKILEKPTDHLEAAAMLRSLSNNSHQVITSYALATKTQMIENSVTTLVHFRTLGDKEIQDYAASEEPMDKSGAYAAQGVGSKFIRSVVGSYSNVIGLPLAEVYDDLCRLGLTL